MEGGGGGHGGERRVESRDVLSMTGLPAAATASLWRGSPRFLQGAAPPVEKLRLGKPKGLPSRSFFSEKTEAGGEGN